MQYQDFSKCGVWGQEKGKEKVRISAARTRNPAVPKKFHLIITGSKRMEMRPASLFKEYYQPLGAPEVSILLQENSGSGSVTMRGTSINMS